MTSPIDSKWNRYKISDLGQVVTGKTPPSASAGLFGGCYPFITPSDMSDTRLVSTERFLSHAWRKRQERLLLPEQSICIVCIGATIGKMCMTSEASFTNQQINSIIVDRERFDPFFLYYLLKTQVDDFKSIAGGAATPIVNKSTFSNVEISAPDLETQRQIAGILSAYDDLIENNTRRIKILEEMAQALYREWFVHFRYPGHEHVPLVDSPAGPVPEGWEVKSFAEVAEFINGYAFKPKQWGTEGKPIIKIKELKGGVTDQTPRYDGNDLPAKYHITNGDILFSWSADLNAYLWSGGDALLNQHLFNVIPRGKMTRMYLFHSLQNSMDAFRSRSLGTTMRHIKRSALDEVCLFVPDRSLLAVFEDYTQTIHDHATVLQLTAEILRRTRDLLVPVLVGDTRYIDTSNP